ncbi:WecB/TagA/CpsF family glycosyltransferase [uncultured Cohaesibacter sp.]|uniref:WecB/TagA/CpsF family glycosyltransferase n=1 Tax=uncultured Cohaesibacter sp. TaxID=1002546 RepID=UPI0029C6D43B|nr:WecB/TagA/CpsF family glycosyltransferase [uncultured Cohaesibacter sp.]
MTAQTVTTVGGLPITVEDCEGAARHMIDHAITARGVDKLPLYSTSANGQVVSMCALDVEILSLFLEADILHADGEPLVRASRLMCKTKLPERVATTDLVHFTARIAEKEGVSFYFLGASEEADQQGRREYEAALSRSDLCRLSQWLFRQGRRGCGGCRDQ